MNTYSYKAPAKVILGGEHAVVYGKPALISAVDLWMEVNAEPGTGDGRDAMLDRIVEKVKSFLGPGHQDRQAHITVSSGIPTGRGLGSSAALCVAASAALIHLFSGKEPDRDTVASCAYHAEKLFHANPSGADTSASCFGGLVFYRKEFEFLKTISALNMKIPESIAKHLLLIDSGAPKENTSDMVQAVGKLYNKDRTAAEEAMHAIEKTVKRMVVSIAKEDTEFFKTAIRDGQQQLERIGVVSAQTRQILETLEPFGTGKVTGAGGKQDGSGYVLFFARSVPETVRFLKERAIAHLPFHPTPSGVTRII